MTTRLIIAAASILALVACSPSDPTPRTEAPARAGAPAAVSPADTPRAPEPMPAPRVESTAPTAPTAADAAATQPLSTLEKSEEQNSMPMAGHGNSHSSPALEPKKDPGKS